MRAMIVEQRLALARGQRADHRRGGRDQCRPPAPAPPQPPSGMSQPGQRLAAVTVSPASARISATFSPGRSGRTVGLLPRDHDAGNLDDIGKAGLRRLQHGDGGALGARPGLVRGEGGGGEGEAEQDGEGARRVWRERRHRHSRSVFGAIDIRRLGEGAKRQLAIHASP